MLACIGLHWLLLANVGLCWYALACIGLIYRISLVNEWIKKKKKHTEVQMMCCVIWAHPCHHLLAGIGCCGLSLVCVGICWPAMACVGCCWLLLACIDLIYKISLVNEWIKHTWVQMTYHIIWPISICWPVLATVGFHWYSLACIDCCWPALAVSCHWLPLACIGPMNIILLYHMSILKEWIKKKKYTWAHLCTSMLAAVGPHWSSLVFIGLLWLSWAWWQWWM